MNSRFRMVTVALASTILVGAARGQTVPWEVFADTISTSVCDVINANNAELVLLRGTSQLVIVTGVDVTLQDTFVDADGLVTFEGEPAGAIGFATDGDGFRTLWWTSLTGTVVNVNGFTGQPTQTNNLPRDFEDVPCDACDFWDDPTPCQEHPDDLPPITVNLCGTDVAFPIGLTFALMCSLSWIRSRRRVALQHSFDSPTLIP